MTLEVGILSLIFAALLVIAIEIGILIGMLKTPEKPSGPHDPSWWYSETRTETTTTPEKRKKNG